jgi:hypothetical protein
VTWQTPLKPVWHQGASTDEVLCFRLAPGYWDSVPTLSADSLAHALEQAVARGRVPATKTPWLDRYIHLLVAEHRHRRGVA